MQKYQNSIQNTDGTAVWGATVKVYVYGTSTLATIYSDNGSTVISNSAVTTDVQGEFSFYAANGRYSLSVIKSNVASEVYSDILLFDPADEAPQNYLAVNYDGTDYKIPLYNA